MGAHYTEYVAHVLRWYAKTISESDKPVFSSDADAKNWDACRMALNDYSPTECETFIAIYTKNFSFVDVISTIAKERELDVNLLWKKTKNLERKVAKLRGLI